MQCRTASFNPWHGIVQHKPLGAVNFARKLSYESAAVYRKHGGCPRQLTADEVFSGPTRPTHSGEGDLKNFKYEAYKLPEFVGLPYKAPDRGVLNLFTPYKYLRLAYSFAFEKWGKAPAKGHGRDEYESMQEYDDDLPQGKNILPRNRVMQLEGPDNVHLANEDWVTGYQAIAGINPMMITKAKYLPNATGLSEDEKIRQLPDDLNMTAVIAHLKQEGTTVAKLIAEERLFFTDFHCLEDIPNKGGTVLYKPVALYWLNSTKNDAARQLMPLAIQLTRFAAEDKRSNRLFTPRDDPDQWLWAKLHLMHADAVTHEALMHLGFTHLAAEPIVIAFNRRLAKDNHILQFMNRHFLETIDINELGRRTLLAPGGQFDQITSLGLNGTLSIMQRGYRHHSSLREDRGWSFGDYNFRNNLQLRGFDFPSYEDAGSSKDDMPGFYYRDDGALVYELIRLYVARHLQRYFEPQEACNVRPQKLWKERGGIVDDKEECDKAVRNDQSLRDLHFELGSESLADIPGEVPLFYESFDALVEFLTTVVFHCSAQHSAVNFAQVRGGPALVCPWGAGWKAARLTFRATRNQPPRSIQYHWYAFTPLRPLQLDAEMPIDNHDLHDLDVKYMINAMSNKKTTHAMRQTGTLAGWRAQLGSSPGPSVHLTAMETNGCFTTFASALTSLRCPRVCACSAPHHSPPAVHAEESHVRGSTACRPPSLRDQRAPRGHRAHDQRPQQQDRQGGEDPVPVPATGPRGRQHLHLSGPVRWRRHGLRRTTAGRHAGRQAGRAGRHAGRQAPGVVLCHGSSGLLRRRRGRGFCSADRIRAAIQAYSDSFDRFPGSSAALLAVPVQLCRTSMVACESISGRFILVPCKKRA